MGEFITALFGLTFFVFITTLTLKYEGCDIDVPLKLHENANLLCESNGGLKYLWVDGNTATIECQNGLSKTIYKNEIKE